LVINELFTLHENSCNCLQILLVKLKELNVFLLKLILDDGSVKKSFEGIEELEFTNDGIAVIETLGEDRSESSLEFLNALSELVEVIIESSLFNVHDIILNLHESFNGRIELLEDLDDGSGKSLSFSVTNLNLLKLLELHDGVGQMHNVLASLLERVQSDEECILGDFPLASDLSLVLMVGFLEFGTSVESLLEIGVSKMRLLILDEGKDLLLIDEVSAPINDCVGDLSNKNNKSGRSVVVLRVSPNEEDGVHDGHEQVSDLLELEGVIGQAGKKLRKSLQVEVVVVSLNSGSLNFFLELGERTSVSGLVLLEELEHLLDALTGELVADVVQVVSFGFPEVELTSWVRVLAALQGRLRVSLEDVLDLLGPVRNGLLQKSSLVLG
jgi:hypothetical protein